MRIKAIDPSPLSYCRCRGQTSGVGSGWSWEKWSWTVQSGAFALTTTPNVRPPRTWALEGFDTMKKCGDF